MDRTPQIVQSRNQLLVKMLWVFYMIDMIKFLLDSRPSLMVALLGTLLLSALTVAAWRGFRPVLVMYLIIGSTFLFFFVLMMTSPFLVNYVFIWFGLVLSAVYQSYGAILFAGGLCTSLTVFFFFRFGSALIPDATTSDVVYPLMFSFFVTTFLLYLTKFTRSLWMEAEESREQLRYILNNVNIAIWEVDMATGVLHFSAGVEKITGLPSVAFQRDSELWKAIIHPEDKGKVMKAYKLAQHGGPQGLDLRIVRPHGEIRWLQYRGIPILNDNQKLTSLKGVVIDITERKEMEEKIQYLAYHDALTELPNRVLFNELAAGVLARAKRDQGRLAMVFFDLSGFKEVNDTFGHDVGDELLKEVASRLRQGLREADTLCRLGGDEFVALLEINNQDDVEVVAARVGEMFSRPFAASQDSCFVDCSMGVSLYPEHGLELDVLIRKADTAMYKAKSRGGTTWCLYQESGCSSDTTGQIESR